MLYKSSYKYLSLVLFFLILYYGESKAQDLVYSGKQTLFSPSVYDLILEASPNYVYREDVYPRITASLNIQYFITSYTSINASLSVGQDYAHFGPGILGVPLMVLGGLLTGQESQDMILFFLIMTGSFENVSFHIPVTSNLNFSPYFSFLRIQYLYDPPVSQMNDFSIGLAFGVRFHSLISNNWIVTPYLEYNRTYVLKLNGFQGGIYIGHYSRSRVLN